MIQKDNKENREEPARRAGGDAGTGPGIASHHVFGGLGGTQLGPAQVRSAQKLGDRPLHLEVHPDAVLAHLRLPHLCKNTDPPPRGLQRGRPSGPPTRGCRFPLLVQTKKSGSPEGASLGPLGLITFRACSAHKTNRSGLKLSVGSSSDFPRLADLIN